MEAGITAICLGIYQQKDKEAEKRRKTASADRGMERDVDR
jgi:hypothetical protein